MRDPTTDETEAVIDPDEIDWSALTCEASPAEVVAGGAAHVADAAHAAPPRPEAEVCRRPGEPSQSFHAAFAEIVSRIEPGAPRALIGSTFARMLRVLDTLGVIEKSLSRPHAVKVGFLFQDVRAQAASLLTQVSGAASSDARLDPRLREVLDGMRFVIGHELAKVFRHEFPALTDDSRAAYSRADLSRAWGLLHNCLQQTAITLAQAFAPEVTGEQLFDDYRRKVENSFALYGELNELLRKARAAEGSNGILLKHALVRHLEHFRGETMHFLMYKDWGEFGRYVDEVKRAFEEMEEFESVLHSFSRYLETLIYHVGMREVLRGVARPPGGQGAGAEGPAVWPGV